MNSRKKSYNRSSTAVNKRSNLGEQQVTINDLKIKATIRKDNYWETLTKYTILTAYSY
jgi:uncharacterized protein involved in exopolysaccharide biosynthesis